VRLEPTGKIRCVTSATDQGQGTWTGITQLVAERLGVEPSDVDIVAHDTAATPYGSGAWASRGLTVAGEAAWLAADALRDNLLKLAGTILQAAPASLTIAEGDIRDAATGRSRMRLAELAHIGHFRHDTLPKDVQPELAATRTYYPKDRPYAVANGVQGSWLEVDCDTGMVRLLGHWIVEDCGRVVNPLLVDEQLRGGIVQGIGSALFEECAYDEHGQLRNGTLADYLVPMAREMPDIHVRHVETRTPGTAIGTKGAGEGGAVGAPAAVLLAVNDAVRPLGAKVSRLPMTPDVVLAAIRDAKR
jgi:carbon-monoxide dehydrogenase large subunit